ncbi:MAG: SDR family NAD(P)-dependent oxidoreductase [Bacteroidales bacterium]
MNKNMQDLIEISRFYGVNKEFVIGGGGNTSYKDENYLYVKASGKPLADISETGFIKIERKALENLKNIEFPDDSVLRDKMIVNEVLKCCRDNHLNLRPSVEAPLHGLINFRFVVHTHSTWVNALLCSNNATEMAERLFPENTLFVRYIDPGYTLYAELLKEIETFRLKYHCDPKIILVQNHGIFVSADTTDEIKEIYLEAIGKISNLTRKPLQSEPIEPNNKIANIIPALRMILSEDSLLTGRMRVNNLILHFVKDTNTAKQVSLPFTPDNIVYCKSLPLFIDCDGEPEEIIELFISLCKKYKADFGYNPKIILLKNLGMVSVAENSKLADIQLDVFEDLMKVSYLTQSFGGPHFMEKHQIDYIENWESENYRHKMSTGLLAGRVYNKNIIVTGAAQGFGNGIAEELFNSGANIVVADLNEAKGKDFAGNLNNSGKNNRAIFVKTDVSSDESVQNLVYRTVCELGGIDVFISNAGILYAGGLDEMTPEKFELMTKVNYAAYFLCTKFTAEVMKLQTRFKKDYFADIIQINSKSGLRGSKKNFAYAGGKFGGIGLTQSFALELMEFNIKVNSICPGNYFDGPLWSDPENGLFVQYLKTGKVPGANTVNDVKKFYENQVPAGRGCRVTDVVRAIFYAIEQEYETGQAIPVTGGQVMIS